MDLLITPYSLSKAYQERLEHEVLQQPVVRTSLKELNDKGVKGLLRFLRAQRVDRVVLPSEQQEGDAALPLLMLIAIVVPTKKICVVGADLSIRWVSALDIARSMFGIGYAMLASMVAVRKVGRQVRHLAGRDISQTGSISRSGRVLYLNANLRFGVQVGGSIGHISGIVNALSASGYKVDFASAGGRLMVDESINYVPLNCPRYFALPWLHNFYRCGLWMTSQLAALDAKQHAFIYQRMSTANLSGVLISRRTGIPLVLEYNGSEVWIAKNWSKRPVSNMTLAESVERANLKHSHFVVTISEPLRDELIERGVPAERIVCYPNCIDPRMFDPARFSAQDRATLRKRHGIDSDAVLVSFIGTFGKWHGAEVLAQAAAELWASDRAWLEHSKVHFMFIGDGLKLPEVRQIIERAGAGPICTFTGLVPQNEASLYLAAADILASPHVANADGSKFFGSPTKLFEYMASGKAIIASDLDQIGEVLGNCVRHSSLESEVEIGVRKRVALLVPPGNAQELAAGLKYLAESSARREALGKNTRELALAKYTWGRHVEEILKVVTGAEGRIR